MSEAQHTPGPWQAIKWSSHAQTTVVTAPWAAVIRLGKHFKSGAVIAECQGARSGYLDDEAEANARLIAAAPEMLAELKRQVQRLYNGFEPDNQSAEYQRVIALIRKAEGQ
jgi:hypothetical protein